MTFLQSTFQRVALSVPRVARNDAFVLVVGKALQGVLIGRGGP